MMLSGRVAVVTGAGKGIGRALALHLAAEGATVVVSSRTESDLDEVVASMQGGAAVVADAMDPQQARRPVEFAVERFGRLDILVNNVGGRLPNDTDAYAVSDETFGDVVTLNLLSGWWTSQAALPHMRAAGWGRIVNIGSGSAKRAGGSIPYNAAKHGVIGLTVGLAAKVAGDGITVNCVCPGWTNTPHNDWEIVGQRWGVTAETAKAMAESENAQHRVLEPDELGPMVALLASDAGAGITGQVISVDGGYKI
jgi:NAD(P)-dependent dehydrogenase (short-subunit alcohol dehydrogenase family)